MRVDVEIYGISGAPSCPYIYDVKVSIETKAKEHLNPIVLEEVERDIERVIYEGVEKARIKVVK